MRRIAQKQRLRREIVKAVAKCFFVVTAIRVTLTLPYNIRFFFKKKKTETHNIDVMYCNILSLYIEATSSTIGLQKRTVSYI